MYLLPELRVLRDYFRVYSCSSFQFIELCLLVQHVLFVFQSLRLNLLQEDPYLVVLFLLHLLGLFFVDQ